MRWTDDHETIFFPADGTHIAPAAPAAAMSTAAPGRSHAGPSATERLVTARGRSTRRCRWGASRASRSGSTGAGCSILGLVVWSLAATVFPEQSPGLSRRRPTSPWRVGSARAVSSRALHRATSSGMPSQAQREGMEIDGITLWVFGGVARFSGMFPSAGAELRIALAGPLVTLVIGARCSLRRGAAPHVAVGDRRRGRLARDDQRSCCWRSTCCRPCRSTAAGCCAPCCGTRTGDFSRATRIAGRARARGSGRR